MHILVTAGNTQVQIDRVRSITNIFTGRTGTRIALHAHSQNHAVTLATSHPEVVAELAADSQPAGDNWAVRPYRTYDELDALMDAEIRSGCYDAVVHGAAVSDYRSAGVYRWEPGAAEPTLINRSLGKIKSDAPELWLRLVRTPKLIDRVRTDWGFAGVLVKFKLEVGVADSDLLALAEESRVFSKADLMVANTLEGADAWAAIGPFGKRYERVSRADLPAKLLDAMCRCHEGKRHG